MPDPSDDTASNSNAISNQRKEATSLLKDRRCSEAEAILRMVLPLIDEKFGETSPEGVSCYRDLLRAVACQRRKDEVRQMMPVAKKRIDDMKQSEFARQQRTERQWLRNIDSDMKEAIAGINADIDDRMAFMAANRGRLGYQPKGGR